MAEFGLRLLSLDPQSYTLVRDRNDNYRIGNNNRYYSKRLFSVTVVIVCTGGRSETLHGHVTFFALVLVAAGALGRGPELLLRTGEADVLLVEPNLGRPRVPGPFVLARRVSAPGPASAHRRRLQFDAVRGGRAELVRRRVVLRRRPGRLVVGPVVAPVRHSLQLPTAVVVFTGL